MEITDSIAEGLLRTVMAQALILRDDPQNYDARAEVMWAGSLSHNGLTGCGHSESDFASHRLEHELGGMFDVARGSRRRLGQLGALCLSELHAALRPLCA